MRRNPVAERSRKGSDERGRQHADEPCDAHPDRPARVVGEDAERDEVRPLGRDRRAPRKLETPEVLVAQDGNESGERVNRWAHPAIESQKPTADKARFVSAGEEVRRSGPLHFLAR